MNLRHATLHQLRIFLAVARHNSFARAAEELHLSPPTLSLQVKQLSETVGQPLFEQLGKKIYLAGFNSIGRQMSEDHEDAAKWAVEQGFADPEGQLRVVFADYAVRGDERVILHVEAEPALHKALKAKKWPEFAKRYNGPAFARNLYDVKLERAYERHAGCGCGQKVAA